MNKYKKIASAVVATVMAGTMVASLAACNPRGPGEDPKKDYTPLTIAIGYDEKGTGVSYDTSNVTGANNQSFGGRKAIKGTLKPAWEGLSNKLQINFKDVFDGSTPGNNIKAIKDGANKLAGVGIFTASTATAIAESENLLDINTILDEVPNYKAFLESNEIVWASLITNATSGAMYYLPYFDGNDDIEKYVLLRKDAVELLLNDSEEYDGDDTTYAAQAAAKGGGALGSITEVKSFMGTDSTDDYTIAVTNPAVLTGTPIFGNDKDEVSDTTATVNVKVSYGAVLTALSNTDSELYKAIDAAIKDSALQFTADKSVSDITSGNIIDIQNFLIDNSKGKVTGTHLVNVLRAYIDTAYLDSSNAPFYVSTNNGLTRASVFNSASAAWDVDLYVALGRCYVTNYGALGVKSKANSYLIGGRADTSQRISDIYSLAGELYGVRGLESRYNFNYIDKNGQLQDARADVASWDAANNINAMVKEGLVYTGSDPGDPVSTTKMAKDTSAIFLSVHDYVQTQSLFGFSATAKGDVGYNFAPVLTPVSRWDDGTGEQPMRFTESWRGVKDGGLCVSKAYYNNASAEVKDAIHRFIDYCYSNDGRILMTYGTQASGKTAKDGLWYGTEVTGPVASVTLNKDAETGAYTDETLTALETAGVIASHDEGKSYYVTEAYQAEYFTYDNILYTGTYYNGRQIPTMTDDNIRLFHEVGSDSFTGYARKFLGTTLPCFEKDQGFEYQCTSDCGKVGSNIVAIALKNGTVKHQYQTLNGKDDKGNYVGGGSQGNENYWYTLSPTYLPYSSGEIDSHSATYKFLSGVGVGSSYASFGFNIDSKTGLNLYCNLMFKGYGGSTDYSADSGFATLPTSAQGIIDKLKASTGTGAYYLDDWVALKQTAWGRLKTWYDGKNS